MLRTHTLEVENVSVDFGAVNFRVVPLHTVRGFFAAEFIEQFQQFFIAANIILLNVFLDGFVILNPQNNVPGFIIGPTVVGYKGSSAYDAGIFYCPYVPLQMVRAVGQDTFQPKIGFKTRYGIVANPFAEGTDQGLGRLRLNANRYYRRVKVSNLM